MTGREMADLLADPEVVEDNPEIAIFMLFLTTCRMRCTADGQIPRAQRPLLAMP